MINNDINRQKLSPNTENCHNVTLLDTWKKNKQSCQKNEVTKNVNNSFLNSDNNSISEFFDALKYDYYAKHDYYVAQEITTKKAIVQLKFYQELVTKTPEITPYNELKFNPDGLKQVNPNELYRIAQLLMTEKTHYKYSAFQFYQEIPRFNNVTLQLPGWSSLVGKNVFLATSKDDDDIKKSILPLLHYVTNTATGEINPVLDTCYVGFSMTHIIFLINFNDDHYDHDYPTCIEAAYPIIIKDI